ncbi:MAG TPA: carboxypeptidase-like regulatory domain-containing protein, partial [Planctomycetota bacterium]|nr:carboxypeptidase-like regulatory domain-containing protein [Planctomycetota bacterium]
MKRKTVRTVALLGGIVLLVAGWWLLLEQAHDAVDEVVALQAAGDGDTARAPGFAAAADDDAAASGTAAEALPRETHVSSLEATRAPGGGSAPLDLLVTHAGGAPATGAVVVIGRDGTVLGKGVTDLAGRVRLVPSGGEADGAAGDAADGAADGAADVLIGGVSDEPVRRRLQSIAGEQTIVLPDGAVVEGRVLVDGAPPRQPLPLSLARADDPERDDVKRDKVWYALRTSWPGSSEWADVNSQIVGADGRFRFSGLQDKAWRFLGAGDAYAWEGDASSAAADGFPAQSEDAADPDRPSMEDKPWFLLAARLVRAPATGLVVRLRGMKRITGRVVEAQGGAPVPFASISFVQRWGSGNSTHASVPRCGADGRFVIALSVAREPVAALSLDIRHPEGRGSRQLEVGAEDCATGKDLGDIALDPALEVRVLVRDESGTPIAGAVAVSDDGRAQRSKPTDAEGRTALHVLPGTASISVWAARCYGQTVPLPPESLPGDELVVVLRRSPTLDVTVVRADGSSPEGLRMTLRCAQQLFDSAGRRGTGDRGFVPSGMVKHFGISIASFHPIPKEDGTAAEASGSMTIHLADEGHVRVDDLLPDVPFDLLVHDTYGGLVHEPQVIRLAPGEQRELRIVVTTTPRDLVLSVTDLQGAPLQASVENPVPATGNKDMWSTKA